MTDPQRHKMVAGVAAVVFACLILYGIVFGIQHFDPKGLLIGVAFFGMAWKISTHKHKRNPLF
ncbi:MAG: hypothetical protein KTQ49_03635 [Candidatus Omnitrophica bacterium]|nr:hypothetical protein [Candidatus Omnitrophota bacterium]